MNRWLFCVIIVKLLYESLVLILKHFLSVTFLFKKLHYAGLFYSVIFLC